MNFTMDFDTFERGIRVLIKNKESAEKINSLGRQIAEDFTYIESFDTYNYIAESLCWWSSVPDARDIVDAFCMDYDFGRQWRKLSTEKEVKLSTIQDLYDYLKGNPVMV